MRVLVTGAAGFLGRHLARAFEARGDEVVGADIAAEHPRKLDALTVFRLGDARFDLVLHCAAVSPHRAAIDTQTLSVGAGCLELDAALFRWAARTHPGRLVYFSSSAAYPVGLQIIPDGDPAEWPYLVPHRLQEDDIDLTEPEAPDAIYGWVKLCGEHLAAAYRRGGGTVTVLRPFSGYGEDQSADFPFGAFRDRARRREDPFDVWGDGSQVRDWVHVDDMVGAVLAAVDNGVDGPVNICTGVGTSMADLARMFTAEAGYRPRFEFRSDKPSGVAYRVGAPTLLNAFYTPTVSLAEGVKRALA